MENRILRILQQLAPEQRGELMEWVVKNWRVDSIELDEDWKKIVGIEESIKEAQEMILHPGKLRGLSTGFSGLNRLTRGMAPEELIVVGGATSHGKSALVQSILFNLALDSIPTLLFTLEMSRAEVTQRFLRMYRMRMGGEWTSDDPTVFDEVAKDLSIHYWAGDKDATLTGVEKSAVFAKEAMGIQLVAIDHLHYFTRSSENMAQEIGLIVRAVKGIARRLKLPIILISHLKKLYNTADIPNLDDLRDSSFIAQDADIVLMVWRDTNADDELRRNTLQVKLRKNRNRGIPNKDKTEFMLKNGVFIEVETNLKEA